MFSMKANRIVALLITIIATSRSASGEIPDGSMLAQRFCPYYKFTVDHGVPEAYRPCTWQWLAAHSRLTRGNAILLTGNQLATDPALILHVPDGDLRTTANPTAPLSIRPDPNAFGGQSWSDVVGSGAGLYCQAEDAGDSYVVLTFWTLFAFNKATAAAPWGGDHEGDITAVTVVYDRKYDRLVRASFGIHGQVIESFDLLAPTTEAEKTLTGKNPDGSAVAVQAHMIRIADDRRFQDGPAWHSPARPSDLYFVHSASGRPEHLVVFHEWGTHEPWPNENGSVTLAPKHTGDDVSFLPTAIRFLGSGAAPSKADAPFIMFNGKWGNDPLAPPFHKSWFYPEGRAKNRFHIAENTFVDRDPFSGGTLLWPPPRTAGPRTVHLKVECANTKGAEVTIRWGHPDFHLNEYFQKWTTKRSQIQNKDFELPDRMSEFEIQTEGGTATDYVVTIIVDLPGKSTDKESSVIRIEHHDRNPRDSATVTDGVGVRRSSALNKYGEQNFRIDLSGDTHGSIP